MKTILRLWGAVIGFVSLSFFPACLSSNPPDNGAVNLANGKLTATVALLDSSGSPVTSASAGVPLQLCVQFSSAPPDETYFQITQQNGQNLFLPTQFTAGQSPCVSVSYSQVSSGRTDNLTVVAFRSDTTQAESVVLTTTNFTVTQPAIKNLVCLVTPTLAPIYIQQDATNQVAAGAKSTALSLTLDCGADNGSVSISNLPSGFQTTVAPTVGPDKKLRFSGSLSTAGTQTLLFKIANAGNLTTNASTAVTVTGVGIFSCTLNQTTNPLTLTNKSTELETYTINFANRVPSSITASAVGGGFVNPNTFKPGSNYTAPNQNSSYTFTGTFTTVGAYAQTITGQDPIFPGKTATCTTALPTQVQLPVPAQITCSVTSINPASASLPVDTTNKILGQSSQVNYTIQLNKPGSVGNITGAVGSGAIVSAPVAGANNSYTFNATFRATGTQTLSVSVTDNNKTSAVCSPSVSVASVIQYQPLTCTLTENVTSVPVQLNASNQPAARTPAINFTVTTNREGATFGGVVGTGNFVGSGLSPVGNNFTFTGTFLAAPNSGYSATVTLNDSKIAGASTQCTTNPTITLVGRAPIACTIVPDFSNVPLPVDAGNNALTRSNGTGATITTSYVSNIPSVTGTGNMAVVSAPAASDNSGLHFRVGVNYSALGSQMVTATVVEPTGASSASCSAKVQVDAFGPSARINSTGLLATNQVLCAPNYSLACWNSILSTDGQYRLDMQNDGNLVLFHVADGLPTWASNTATSGAAYATIDSTTGNLVLRDGAGNNKFASGGSYPGGTLSVQTDANLVIYQAGAAKWASATKGWFRGANLLYKNGYVNCTGTPRSPAAAGINNCILYTPTGWTMLLDNDTYVVETGVQIVLNKPMTLSTNGGWGSSTPCFNVPVQNNPDAGTQLTGVPCAQIVPENNSHFPWGGFFIMGQPNGKVFVDGQNYSIPLYNQISNVNVDHINLNGNYIGRYATSVANGQYQQINEFVNSSVINCSFCSFKNSATQYSLAGGMSMEFNTDNFIADHNSYYWHGNLKEQKNGAQAPRHGGCTFVQGVNSQFTSNFLRHCADEAVLIVGATNGLVTNNVFYARDNDYSSTVFRIQPDTNQAGLRVNFNAIDCADGECTTGITVGADQFAGTLPGNGGVLMSGIGASGVQVQNNIIGGSDIGILVGFRAVAGNAVYISGNAIFPHTPGKVFSPMACKQWYGSRPTYNCCQPDWYDQRMPNWLAPFTNLTMSFGGNPIIGSAIMIDPSDWLQVLKDNNGSVFGTNEAYAASWKGGGGGADDSSSCF